MGLVCKNGIVQEEVRIATIKTKMEQDRKDALERCDNSTMPASLYVMSMLSDAQEASLAGYFELAYQIMNDAKVIIDARLAKKDAQGRHE